MTPNNELLVSSLHVPASFIRTGFLYPDQSLPNGRAFVSRLYLGKGLVLSCGEDSPTALTLDHPQVSSHTASWLEAAGTILRTRPKFPFPLYVRQFPGAFLVAL